MVNVLSNKIERNNLMPGDHIYSWRSYVYAHHGIYIGDGKVIHFTSANGTELGNFSFLSSSSSSIPCTICTRDQQQSDGVLSSCLECFLSRGKLYRFEYGVSRTFFLAKARGGTCSLAPSDPSEDVLHRARYLLENGFGSYHLFKNNCESFATYCKTGMLVMSGQVASRVSAGDAVGSMAQAASVVIPVAVKSTAYLRKLAVLRSVAVGAGIVAGVGGVVIVGAWVYCTGRLSNDIGASHNMTKIPVEILVAQSDYDDEVNI